jgi:hypothetical protein
MDWVWVEIEHGWGIQAGVSGGGAVTARWRGSCGSAELAALLLLHFWLVRNKNLKSKNNPLWKQTMDAGILPAQDIQHHILPYGHICRQEPNGFQ